MIKKKDILYMGEYYEWTSNNINLSIDSKCEACQETIKNLIKRGHLKIRKTTDALCTASEQKKGCGKHFVEPFDYTCGHPEVNGTPLCPDCTKDEGGEE